ncbi:MAG TPA: TraR/DksA C4-type zinc finger protein [Bryobacteraceae bacterium]|nr:TraR/DksA C4-type zinc finger protein [Bryobacteraceae bacterium]
MKSASKKYENYRKILEHKAEELQRSMSAQKVSQMVSRRDHASDEGDLSQQSHEEWIFLNRNTLDMKLLRDVQHALRRIEQGTYGVCHECEEAISVKRLDALPWALYCVACQERTARGTARENEDDFQEAEL